MTVEGLIRALRYFNTLDNKMQVSTILTLLEIAHADNTNNEISVTDIQNRVGLKSGTASRNVGYWADGNRDVIGEYRMVRSDVSQMDHRRRSLHLTEKGKAFVNFLVAEMGNEHNSDNAN